MAKWHTADSLLLILICRSPYDNIVEVLKRTEIPYDCAVDPSFIGYVSTWFFLVLVSVTIHPHMIWFSVLIYNSNEVVILSIRYAKPWVDPDSSNSYCLFFPYSPEHLVHSLPKSKGMKSDISVSINTILKESNDAMGSASALFIGGFSILGMGKVTSLIFLLFLWPIIVCPEILLGYGCCTFESSLISLL